MVVAFVVVVVVIGANGRISSESSKMVPLLSCVSISRSVENFLGVVGLCLCCRWLVTLSKFYNNYNTNKIMHRNSVKLG